MPCPAMTSIALEGLNGAVRYTPIPSVYRAVIVAEGLEQLLELSERGPGKP
jgi:hypothetical protein